MKKYILIIGLIVPMLTVVLWKGMSSDADLIIPGVRVGRISASSSEQELIQLYGKQNVIRDTIHVCDGYDGPGTIIYPQDELQKLEIIWKDLENFRNPDFVIIRGSHSKYRTSEGITLGTTLKELEKLNGKPFTFYGFEWDFQGLVLDWWGGKLGYLDEPKAGAESGTMSIALTLGNTDNVPWEEISTIIGDKVISSMDKTAQKLNPIVNNILVKLKR
jgi:hypothetical protein